MTLAKFTNYYTSADTFVMVEHSTSPGVPVRLDKMASIAFGESSSARPVYGIGQPVFGFTNLGNLIVSGELLLRFTDEDYLLYAIKAALGQVSKNDTAPTNIKQEFLSAATAEAAREVVAKDISSRALSSSRLYNLPQSFNFRVVFNNSNLYHKSADKTLLIKDVRILSSEIVSSTSRQGPIDIKYNFIARMVS